MTITVPQIVLLGILQGAAELLPVSSSAHVIVAEKLMRLDPSSPEMTFLLVMLHTGTMFAVIAYFWKAWKESYFESLYRFGMILSNVIIATGFTVAVGLGLKTVIEKIFLHGQPKAEWEQLFARLPLVAAALAVAGLLIIFSGLRNRREYGKGNNIDFKAATWIGIMQGFCLPFRGLSRSGTTISTGMLLDVDRRGAEEFSFALAVVITPLAVGVELHRLLKAQVGALPPLGPLLGPGLIGMACSFIAGILALRLLSRWLEGGRWHYFGCYCLVFAVVVEALAIAGF